VFVDEQAVAARSISIKIALKRPECGMNSSGEIFLELTRSLFSQELCVFIHSISWFGLAVGMTFYDVLVSFVRFAITCPLNLTCSHHLNILNLRCLAANSSYVGKPSCVGSWIRSVRSISYIAVDRLDHTCRSS
jgi:hypothetical protein